jgi:outer membrane lipoprotein
MRRQRGNRSIGYKIALFLLLLTNCGLDGCAPALSREFRRKVGPRFPFQELLEDAGAHKGERVILGGYILETVNEPGGSLLTMLQTPLNYQNKPKSQDLSEGRFLVQTEKFLDPEIFSKGRKLTVGGRVSGALPRPLGNRTYQYPVIEAEELHLWPKEVPYGTPYDPYFYNWHDPWYHYPYYPCAWFTWY